MTTIMCSEARGRLIAISSKFSAPLSIALGTPRLGGGVAGIGTSINRVQFENMLNLGVATSITASQNVAAQFQNAFNDAIYVTPFGDTPGEVHLSFIINAKCNTNDGNSAHLNTQPASDKKQTGQAIEYYLKNRLSPYRSRPLVIVIGPMTLKGYLIGLQVPYQAQSFPIAQAVLSFKAWIDS